MRILPPTPSPDTCFPSPEAASVTSFLGLHPQTSTDKQICVSINFFPFLHNWQILYSMFITVAFFFGLKTHLEDPHCSFWGSFPHRLCEMSFVDGHQAAPRPGWADKGPGSPHV